MTKTIIYLRTSTKDQNPELQRKDCIEFASKIYLEVIEIVSEQGSAYKLEKVRPLWKSVVERAKKENLDIIVWRYDRAFRNRAEFFSFMKVMFEVYHTKVYSVTEPSILGFWNMMSKSHSENPIFNELLNGIFSAMWDFMIQQSGEEAEEESRKKSQRVKLAVRKKDGEETKSYKGNKWGRKTISTQKINKLIEYIKLNPEADVRTIGTETGISKSAVHKYLAEIKGKKQVKN
jgi:DNA invertase Pin-like site-specific DNA recombinase